MLSDMKETTEILQLHLPTKAMGRLTQSDTNVFIPAPFTSYTAETGL